MTDLFPRYFVLPREPRESPLLYIRHDDAYTDPKCIVRGCDEAECRNSPWPLSNTIELVARGLAVEITPQQAAFLERGDTRALH